MFRAIITPMLRSCVYSLWYNAPTMLPTGSLDKVELRSTSPRLPVGSIAPQHAHAPQYGRNYRPKHVELIEIINKPLLLNLVGCLYYYSHVEVYRGLVSTTRILACLRQNAG